MLILCSLTFYSAYAIIFGDRSSKMGIVKKTVNWFKNYWYYYKWPVIIIGFFAIVLIFLLAQTGDTEKYDASILYTGPHVFEVGEKDGIASTFSQVLSKDHDKDGAKRVQLIDMPAFTDEQMKEALGEDPDISLTVQYAPYNVDNVKSGFSNQVTVGEASVCLLDEYWYSLVLDVDGLVKLEEVLGYRPDFLVDDYSCRLGDLEIYKYLSTLPEDTLVCFRKLSTASAFTGTDAAKERYEHSKELLRDIFTFSAG